MFKLVLPGPYHTGFPTPDMFKLLHYKLRTIGKRVDGIQVERFHVVEADRRLGNGLADQILHLYSGDHKNVP